MAKMGRPIKKDAKRTKVTVRLDDEGLMMLKTNAEHFDDTLADSLRRAIYLLYKEIKKE